MQQPVSQSTNLPIGARAAPDSQTRARRRTRDRRSVLQSMFFRPDGEVTQEQGQAVARILLAAFGTLLFYAARQFGHGDQPFLLALAYMLASFFYLSFVSRNTDGYLWRRYAVILLDIAVATYLTAYFTTAGVAFYPLFLWVMIGNGIRYGERFMQFATLFGLLGFSGAMATNGYLWNSPGTYIGLMFGLVLMPKFFLIMIDRLAEANIELKEKKEQAEFMATHDVLTGLPNRAYLYTRMEQTLAYARRTGKQVAVAFIDLDSFKSINDSFGHEYGDFLLCQVADAMKGVLRASDTVSRLGGDEFVVVIEESEKEGRVGRVIQRLFSCVGRYYTIGEYETYVTWSCGVVVYPRDGDDVHNLLKHADTAMYAAKSRGPNHFAFYDAEMSAQVGEQLAMRDDLRMAMDRGQLEVFYQPIVEAQSGRIRSAEALLRWNHPEKGILSPSQFIEVAEQSGLINPIGDWVLQQALQMLSSWRLGCCNDVTVHVNVSAHQLKQDGFVENVQALLRAARLPSQALELEMTESALIEHSTRTSGLLAALKKIGVKIALDDFGTGFSSLSYLKSLPVDTIKIDKSFIDDLPAAGRDAALVESILTLGARLGNNVVAEGVETAPQIDWLVSHGCRYLQGYHFSQPVPLDQFLTLVTSGFESPTALGKPHGTERLGVLATNKR